MNTLILNHNQARLIGTVAKVGKTRLVVCSKRLSGKEDNVVVCLPNREDITGYRVGDRVAVNGKLRSHRVWSNGNSNKLELFIEATTLNKTDIMEDENLVNMTGYVNKTPILRETPLGKTITDISVVCQHKVLSNGKLLQDVIPCIAWNNVAEDICASAKKNYFIKLFGRVEERIYIKDEVEHTVHELSTIAGTVSIPSDFRDFFVEDIVCENPYSDIEHFFNLSKDADDGPQVAPDIYPDL